LDNDESGSCHRDALLIDPDDTAGGGGTDKESSWIGGVAITGVTLWTGVVRVAVIETVVGGLVMWTTANGAALAVLCSEEG
jgi:hypothetical protein